MKKFLVFAVLTACLAGILVSAAAARTSSAKATSVTVVMRDPGCHWFQVGAKYEKSLSVKGPVSFLNIDEAALKIVGHNGTTLAKVGHKLHLLRGVYHITMVGQAPDDNHLLLVVK